MKTLSAPVLLLAACSMGGGGGDFAIPGDMAQAADMAMIPKVPDPGGSPIGSDWLDTEPNDTPDRAVRVGTATSGDVFMGALTTWFGFNLNTPTQIGGTDKADYYVFNSGPATQFYCRICWQSVTANLVDYSLYQVVDGQPLVEVASSADADKKCENVADKKFPITPNTKYLLAVTSVEGQDKYDA